jgi:hypothetical protein
LQNILADNEYQSMDLLNYSAGANTVFDFLMTITRRIKKYEHHGFEIKDPYHLLVTSHSSLLNTLLIYLDDTTIHGIEKQGIFQSSKSIKKQVKFLTGMKNLVSENQESLEITSMGEGLLNKHVGFDHQEEKEF